MLNEIALTDGPGIWKVTCTETDNRGVFYSPNVNITINMCLYALSTNCHVNKRLQRDFNLYGEKSITFILIEPLLGFNLAALHRARMEHEDDNGQSSYSMIVSKGYVKKWSSTRCQIKLTNKKIVR